MSLHDKIAEFIAQADARPARSKLEPFADLVRELRQRRWTFQRIAAALRERFGVSVSPSTVHDFVRVRAHRARIEPTAPPPAGSPAEPSPAPRKRRFHLEM
jgi:IS30 family transposase